MKVGTLLLLVLLIATIALATTAGVGQPAGYKEVPVLRATPTDALWCSPISGGYDQPPEFRETKGQECREAVADLNVNFDRERLIFWSAGGDCHVRVALKIFRSDSEQSVRVITNTIYGGCRAAGRRAGWIVIGKPPSGYSVTLEDVAADPRKGEADGPFQFPLPPAVVTREDVPVKLIDLDGCLPLTGNSRWLISTSEHLTRALEGRTASCREKLETLRIDFTQVTLAGASFESGYCDKPNGLRLTMMKETSTHPGKNAYILNAVFDDPKDPCKTWRTYPVWLLMPKLTAGYAFDVHARGATRIDEPRRPEPKTVEWLER